MKGIKVCNDCFDISSLKGGEFMKTQHLVLGIIAIFLVGGGFLFLKNQSTQTASPPAGNISSTNETSSKDKKAEENMMGAGYIVKNGKMMVEENDKLSSMTRDVTLKDGAVVTTSGKVTKKDGSTFSLTEGQSIWTDGTFMKEEAKMQNSGTNTDNALASRYLDYSPDNLTQATKNNGKAVIFFAALKWCPSCQAADKDFKANFNQVPKDITILKADYDTAKDLKQKYAITMQDTFVQVDREGKEITRWNSGGQGVKALLASAK